ncbi:MAG: Flp pilus assembly protein CpaB [Ornithinibacter sp.]
MGRRILAIVAAAVIALVGALLVLVYAKSADSRAVAAASPRTVYISTKAVPAGTSLKEAVRLGDVEPTTVAAASLPTGALTAVDDENSALLALTDIAPGQYVLAAAFGETPVGEKAIVVPPGMLAMSVQLSDPARVGTFVTPGSNLTVFATYKMKKLGDSKAVEQFNQAEIHGTSVLLDNVKVIAMGTDPLVGGGQATPDDEEKSTSSDDQEPSFLVTLAVTPQQATTLAHGVSQYDLYAGLRGAEAKVDPRLSTSDLTVMGATTP